MTAEKPLHVQVAEALGWTMLSDASKSRCCWYGIGPSDDPSIAVPIPNYDTDWSATGPLIEKYGLSLNTDWGFCAHRGEEWQADAPYHWDCEACEIQGRPKMRASTPLIAACNLIIFLAGSGKLKAKAA